MRNIDNMDEYSAAYSIGRGQKQKRVIFWALLTLMFCIAITTLFYHLGKLNSEASMKTNGDTAATATDQLNIRSGPSTKCEIVCTVPRNAVLKLTGKANRDGTWVQVVTCGGKTGWCCRPYLKTNTECVSASKELVQTGNPQYIKVSLERQKVTVFNAKGNIVKDFVCSSGRNGSDTPTGTFTVSGRGTSFYNSELGEGAYYWTSFYGDYLFHSIPFDQNYEIKRDEAAKLGTPASHGCIRLSLDNAKWIYDRIPNGTRVIIANS